MVRLEIKDFLWICQYAGLNDYAQEFKKAQKEKIIDGYETLTKYLLNNYRIIRFRVNIDETLKTEIQKRDVYRLIQSGMRDEEIVDACVEEAIKIIMIQYEECKDNMVHDKMKANMILQLIHEKIRLLDLLPIKGDQAREVIEAQYIDGDYKMSQNNIMLQFDYAITVYYQLRNMGIENLSLTLWDQIPFFNEKIK